MKTKLLFGLLFIASLQFTNAQAGHTIGLVGAFNGWAAPDAMLSTTDDVHYHLMGWVLAADGEIKFRQDENWNGTAWGATNAADFPSGTGDSAGGGGNIVALAGTYNVEFNVVTGVYMFYNQSISLIGDFNSWTGDTYLTSTDNINYSLMGLNVAASGGIKFRQDADWATNWGSVDFPSGIGTQGGSNIPITMGSYDVTFNFTTGAYNFAAATMAVDDFTKNIQFYYTNNTLNINGYNGKISIKAFDVVGRQLYNKENVLVSNGFSQSIKLPKNQVSFILIKGEGFTKSLKVISE